MMPTMGLQITPAWLEDMADALALEAELIAEDGDFTTAEQLRNRAAVYHEFVRAARMGPADEFETV